jgi:signal transduction histidine kinase
LILSSGNRVVRAIVRRRRRASTDGGPATCKPTISPVESRLLLRNAFALMTAALRVNRNELARLAEEQGALRRVATLVARGAPPAEVFAAVANETGRLLAADYMLVKRYEQDFVVVVGNYAGPDVPELPPPLGGRWLVQDGTLEALALETGESTRATDYPPAGTQIGAWTRARGLKYFVICPITVDARVWGAVVNLSTRPQPDDTEARMREFTELVATAIANTHNHGELIASRARVVAASDATRRRIERDLHDGVQQRLIALGLEICAAEAAARPDQAELRTRLTRTAEGLGSVLEDLREIARGLHPTILSTKGLPAALRSLARRSPVPVEIDLSVDRRLPEPIEAAAYYIISEALANILKYAGAAAVRVEVGVEDEAVRIHVVDDGIGGADFTGTGLLGIRDRVEAFGGQLELTSPIGKGTALAVSLPLAHVGSPDR